MGRPNKYPEEFRREAVELYRSSDRSRAEVAKSLGIADGSLAAWVKQAERDAVSRTEVFTLAAKRHDRASTHSRSRRQQRPRSRNARKVRQITGPPARSTTCPPSAARRRNRRSESFGSRRCQAVRPSAVES